MPAPVPDRFSNEPQYSLWRDIARLQEDYQSSTESFIQVLDDIKARLENPELALIGLTLDESVEVVRKIAGHEHRDTHV